MLLARVVLSTQYGAAVGVDGNTPCTFPWAGRVDRVDCKFGNKFLVVHVHAESREIILCSVNGERRLT